jgi:hypothetical protein
MESVTFEVEADELSEFVKILTENDLTNEIVGQSGEGEYFVSVDYEEDGQEAIGELLEIAVIADEDELEAIEDED